MARNIVAGPEVGYWIAANTPGCCFSRESCTAIGLEKDGIIVAGVMYENWNGRALTAHTAIVGRLTRSFIGAIFRYAYIKCGVEKVILPIPETNTKSNAFARNLGFTEEARLKDAAPGGDIILYTLRKADCRFLGDKYA